MLGWSVFFGEFGGYPVFCVEYAVFEFGGAVFCYEVQVGVQPFPDVRLSA